MGIRRMVLIPAAMVLLCGMWGAKAQGNSPLPTDRAAMTEQLITRTRENFPGNIALSKASPDETFEIVRDHWKDLTNTESKQSLLFAIMRSENPHVLEILDIGAHDTNASIQTLAYQLLQNFSFRNFSNDPAAYRTWRDGIAGKSLAGVVASGCTAFVARFLKTDDSQRSALYNVLASLDFSDAGELAKVRRRAAVDAGILNGLAKVLAAPITTSISVSYAQLSFQVVRSLKPDEAFIKRAILPLTARQNSPYTRQDAAVMLGSVNSAWAADRLFEMLTDDTPTIERSIFLSNLANSNNPYLIPKMIGLLEADDSPQTVQRLGYILSRLTGTTLGLRRDGVWWRAWWERSKTAYPQDVQAVPIPRVRAHRSRDAEPFSIRRHAERHLLGGDSQRAYWLLCPAYIAPANAQAGPVPPKPAFGLIVVLADGDGNGEDLTGFWQEAIQKSLKDGYFVALPIAPKWSAHQPAAWLTRQNVGQVKEARFSTETFLNDVVTDVSTRYSIDPNRLFLHGIGEGGLAAYACSLSDTTPFRGFYILSAPFKTAQLPALTHAKGRRYLIQQSKNDKVTPYFQAAAADELLRKQAAVEKLIVTTGEHGYKFAESPWEQIAQAIGWLEAPH